MGQLTRAVASAHSGQDSAPRQRGTHLAAAEDVGGADAHVEAPEHGLGLLRGLEAAVHPETAPIPDLGPELWRGQLLSSEQPGRPAPLPPNPQVPCPIPL